MGQIPHSIERISSLKNDLQYLTVVYASGVFISMWVHRKCTGIKGSMYKVMKKLRESHNR